MSLPRMKLWVNVLVIATMAMHQVFYSQARKEGLEPEPSREVARESTMWLENVINARITRWNRASLVNGDNELPG